MFNNYYKNTVIFRIYNIYSYAYVFKKKILDVLGFFSPVIALILALPP